MWLAMNPVLAFLLPCAKRAVVQALVLMATRLPALQLTVPASAGLRSFEKAFRSPLRPI
jgi:hypothetical protein